MYCNVMMKAVGWWWVDGLIGCIERKSEMEKKRCSRRTKRERVWRSNGERKN